MKKNLLIILIFHIFKIFSAENNFVIIIPSYNNAKFLVKNLDSALHQNYKNYRIIYVDDASTDETFTLLNNHLKLVKPCVDIKIIKNSENKGALYNFYHTIHQNVMDDEIVVCLDGDDQLAHNNVLSFLNKIYENKSTQSHQEIWLTYGQFSTNRGSLGFAREYAQSIVKTGSFRNAPWSATHLKSFKAWLFKKINKDDFLYNGSFFRYCSDMAFMFPMLEMGRNHIQYIQEILYIYNLDNPISEFRKSRKTEMFYGNYIRSLKKYSSLD